MWIPGCFHPHAEIRSCAGTEYFFEMNIARRSLSRVLTRSDQLDPMIAPLQPVDDARERHRDTVHLGRIGFRDNCYPQG